MTTEATPVRPIEVGTTVMDKRSTYRYGGPGDGGPFHSGEIAPGGTASGDVCFDNKKAEDGRAASIDTV